MFGSIRKELKDRIYDLTCVMQREIDTRHNADKRRSERLNSLEADRLYEVGHRCDLQRDIESIVEYLGLEFIDAPAHRKLVTKIRRTSNENSTR